MKRAELAGDRGWLHQCFTDPSLVRPIEKAVLCLIRCIFQRAVDHNCDVSGFPTHSLRGSNFHVIGNRVAMRISTIELREGAARPENVAGETGRDEKDPEVRHKNTTQQRPAKIEWERLGR